VRENGNVQSVVFFNPDARPIVGLASSWQKEAIKKAESDLLDLELYFDPNKQQYSYPVGSGWIPLSTPNAKKQLIAAGFRAKKWEEELPAHIDFLLNRWEIPKEIQCPEGRFGVKAFHHPGLLAELNEIGSEMALLEYIRLFLPEDRPWKGTAAQLSEILRELYPGSRDVMRWNNAVGTYLGRLSKKYPDKINVIRSAKKREWIIQPDL
jgi:hypothetical protein